VENKFSVDEKKNKKALILFKKEKSKKIISQENRNNSKENLATKITNNTTNNTYINSNSKTKTKSSEPSTGIRIVKITKNKNEVKKNNYLIKKEKNVCNKLNIRKKLEHNSSYNNKKPKKINTENNIIINNNKITKKEKYKNNYTCNNNEASSYIKLKIKEKSKESKSNISNYDKRRNYNVPKFRIKKTNENETRKEEDTTTYNEDIRKNEKEKNVQKLLENVSYIKNLQKMMEKEMQTKENKDYENKRKFIEDNGYDLLSDEEDQEDKDNDEEIKTSKEEEKNAEIKENNNNININNNINNVVSNNSLTNNNSSNINNNNNYNFISNNNVNMNLSGSSDKNMNNNETENNKKKEKRKSSVNTFEFCNKINQFINISELKKDYYNLNININDSLGDSFRKSFSNSAKKEINPKKEKAKKIDINENNSSDSDSKFNYNTKENKRSETEIKKYMERKKKELKLEQEKKKKKTQEKKLNRYLILNKLNEDIMSNMNKNMSKIKNEEEKKEMQEKIPNEYFVGKNIKRKNSNISHTTESSQSTVLDSNNYYLELIMSKNILSNNIINNNLINYNNRETNNEINNDNNPIITTKDKDIQNTNDINTNNSNNKLSQEIINNNNINTKDKYGELQLKCKETLDKANIFFSETNMKALIQQYKEKNFEEEKNNTSDINNNINNENDNIINNSDKKDDIIINSEKNENIENKEIENIIQINKKEDEVIDINVNDNNDNENNKIEEEQIIIKEETKEIEDKKEIEETKEIEENKEKELDIKNQEIIPAKKTYEFSKLVLENYYKIFISLEDYLNSLTKKNALNDIITYGEQRFSYKIGFENLIILIKSFPFNVFRMIYQRQYYKDVLRQFFIPYIRRAFNNINLYAFYLFKFSEINKAIEQIYRIIFLKRLNFYAQVKEIIKKEFNEKINGFIIKINIFFKNFFFKQLIQSSKCNNIIELSDKKNNTYLYESFSEKSSLTAYPNTEGSARLHKVYELLEMQRKPKNDEENNLLEIGDNNSIRSIKSVEEKKGKNLLDKMKAEDNLNLNNNIPLEELKNELNNEINNSDSYKGCIKKIEITNNFKINKNNNIMPNKEINNNESNNQNNNNIILETNEKKSRNNNTNENKEKNDENINNIDIDISNTNTILSKSNNYTANTNDIIKISEDLNNQINNISLGLTEKEKSELSDNIRYPKSNTVSERNEIKTEINIINDNNNDNILKKIPENIIQNISDDLCQNILDELIISEIKGKKKLFPKRKKEFNTSLNNSSGSLLMSQNSLSIGSHSPGRNYPQKKNLATQNNNNDSYQGVNSSQTESMLNNSIFMRTVDEIKKEKNLNFYNEKVSKKFLEKIEKNLDKNYEKIIDNLKNPFEIDEARMINGLMLRDKSLSISSKIRFKNEKILKKNNYIDKKIISDFEIINKEIRDKNSVTKGTKENIIYDNYLNQCIYDTINELIEKERKYGIIGAPLFWSIRTKEIDFKYKSKDSFSKKVFIDKIMSQISQILNSKMGLIAENYEYLDMEQLNSDRDKKFMESITQELKENELYYQIFETQETYVKLSLSRIILDQLLNEIVEILEHVQYSRKEPDKYQSKSIYACEDIPRLSFQPQTLENNYTGDNEGDESINQ